MLLISVSAFAHNPDVSSTMLVDKGQDQWVLQIRAALTAFEYEVEYNLGKDSYATPEEFQDLVLQHVRDNMSIISAPDLSTTLKHGIVNLGHETSVSFVVSGMPKTFESLKITNSSFKNIPRNKSALIIFKEGVEKDQFTLDNKNMHTADLQFKNSKFEMVTTEAKSNTSEGYIIGSLILIFLLGYLMYRWLLSRKQNTTLQTSLISA